MKRIIPFLLLIASCSPLSELIIQEPEEDVVIGLPSTKADGNPATRLNYHKALHIAQSNHITMIVKHVTLIDSTYVQTLTEEDFNALGFTKEEIDFSNHYVGVLNGQLKEDVK